MKPILRTGLVTGLAADLFTDLAAPTPTIITPDKGGRLRAWRSGIEHDTSRVELTLPPETRFFETRTRRPGLNTDEMQIRGARLHRRPTNPLLETASLFGPA